MAWRPKYKQLCAICRKSHVLISSRGQFPICTPCSMKQINQPIADEKFRKLFDIGQKLYEQSSFLRSIKSNYLRFGNLSDRQVEMFRKVAGELANPAQKSQMQAGVNEAENSAITERKTVKARSSRKVKAKKPKVE